MSRATHVNGVKIFLVLGRGQFWFDGKEYVPWDFVAPHEPQAKRNHSQSLRRLHDRGGLGPSELYYVLKDLPFPAVDYISEKDAETIIKGWIKEWEADNENIT